jgi:hypothetical protein
MWQQRPSLLLHPALPVNMTAPMTHSVLRSVQPRSSRLEADSGSRYTRPTWAAAAAATVLKDNRLTQLHTQQQCRKQRRYLSLMLWANSNAQAVAAGSTAARVVAAAAGAAAAAATCQLLTAH